MGTPTLETNQRAPRRPGAWVGFSRRADLPGVELRTVVAERDFSADSFARFSSDYEFLGPITFRGEIWHRQRWVVTAPGWLLAAGPGEVFVGRRVLAAGSFCSVSFDAALLASYLEEHGLSPGELELLPLARMSAVLRASFLEVIDAFAPTASRLEVETALTVFLAAMLRELSTDALVDASLPKRSSDVAEHVREQLSRDTLGRLDLTTLADEVGLSRYQVLRAFKRRYGLPPQSYRMHVRIAIAQRMLRSGVAPAVVAAELGFVDQSHLTRHFKRVLGVTPAVYARSTVDVGRADPRRPEAWTSEVASAVTQAVTP